MTPRPSPERKRIEHGSQGTAKTLHCRLLDEAVRSVIVHRVMLEQEVRPWALGLGTKVLWRCCCRKRSSSSQEGHALSWSVRRTHAVEGAQDDRSCLVRGHPGRVGEGQGLVG